MLYKNQNNNTLFRLLVLFFFIFSPFVLRAATVLSDDFTGTTIDTNKWVEIENQGTGDGGSLGNVRQNSSLTIVGNSAWNSNGLKTVSTFDRANGDITIDVDWTLSSCAATTGGLAYGSWVNGTLQTGTILLNRLSGAFKLWAFATQVNVTDVNCADGQPIHVKMVIKQAGGVDVYVNGSLTPNASLTSMQAPNSWNNHPIHLQQYDTTTLTFDNLVVSQGVDATAPSTPTDLEAVSGSEEVALSWTAPNDGGASITDYIIEYKLTSEPTTWTTFTDGTSTGTTAIVTGLTNDLSYDFRVSAINSVGTSLVSDIVSSTPALSAPSAPRSLLASIGTSGQVNLSWTLPLTNGGAIITDYIIEYKLSTESTVWVTVSDGTSTNTTYTVTGLTDNLLYNFRVSAINSVGTGIPSSLVNATPSNYALYDNFAGTTINTDVWTEIDSVSGGAGGLLGNVRQNNGLTIIGNSIWGGERLVSKTLFDRSDEPIFEVEFSIDSSASYGAPVIFSQTDVILTNNPSENIWLVLQQGIFSLARGLNGSWIPLTSTSITYSANTRYKARMTVNASGGASYEIFKDLNDDGDFLDTGEDVNLLAGVNSLSEGTFSTGYFMIGGYSPGIVMTIYKAMAVSAAATAPSTPTDLEAVSGSEEVALSWTAPNNGGSAITDYVVEYKLSSEPTTWSTFSDGVSTNTSTVVTGLTNNLSYDFRVSATNSVGTGIASSTVSSTPAFSAPSAPRNLIATIGTSGQLNLSWISPLTNGGAAVSDYRIEYKLSTEPTTWTIVSDGTSTNTTYTVTGLTDNLLYNFRVSAINSVGTGIPSSVANATPSNYALYDNFAGTTINTDTWLEVDSVSGGTGGLVGNVRQNNYLTVTGNNDWGTNGVESIETFDRSSGDVEITAVMQATSCTSGNSLEFGYGDMDITHAGTSYIVTKNDSTWSLYSWNNGSSAGVSTINGVSCSNDTDLTLRLVVLEAGGAQVYVDNSQTPGATQAWGTFTNAPVWLQNYSSGVTTIFKSITVEAPAVGPYPPINLNGNAGDGQVSLSWTSGGDNGSSITDYLVEYKISSESVWNTFNDGVNSNTSSIVTGLTNGISYSFRVSAININGTSDSSITVSVTPVSSTPTAPTAVSVSIVGEPSIDEQITGTYVFADPNANTEAVSLYRWLVSDTLGGTYLPINGATSINYNIVSANLNKYIKFEVTPIANVAPTSGSPVLSSAIGPINEINYFNHILSTGQSLSTGTNGAPALSTTQPYQNKMLSGASLVPLVESGVETMSSALANTITSLSPGGDFQSAVTRHGVGGTAYSGLKKGTSPYSTGIVQATNVRNAATALGLVDRVIGVTTIHGESDHLAGTGASYESYLVEWQNDYETDVKAITGQSSDIPLFTDQMSSQTGYNAATSLIPLAQLSASVNNPGKIILVGPKYFLGYSDSAHLNAASYRKLGEYYGKVIKKVIIDHEEWRPLSPDNVVRSGNIIYADFHVPSGVLAFDTTLVNAKSNYGFEYYDSTSSATISSVEILDADTVKVTLSNIPTGNNQRLRYAYTGTPGAQPGASIAGSAHGNLRDTDSTPSLYGNTLYNWAVHFDEAIILDSTLPTVTAFSIPQNTNSLTVDISTLTATDDISVSEYLLTESATTPDAGDANWTTNAPTTYTFSTRGNKTLYAWAKDSAGNISTSLNDSITITLVPNPPTGVMATAGNTQAGITFNAPVDNGGSEITGYIVVSSPAGGIDSNQGSTNLTHTITGLTNGTTYTFTVTATNAVGTSSTSSSSNQITPTDSEDPIISTVTSIPSDTTSTITWVTDELSSSMVDYGLSNTYGENTNEINTSPRVLSHTVILSNLVSCTTYHYRVKSTDGATNTATGNDNTFTTTGCTGDGEVISNTDEEVTTDTGGTLNLADGDSNGLTLIIPPAFSELDAIFQAQQLDSDTVIAVISTPTGLSSVGSYVYQLQALTDTSTLVSSFDEPLTITFSYNPSDIPNIDESTLSIYRYDGNTWSPLSGCTVNTNLNTVTCTTTNLSLFGLFGLERAEASSNHSTGSSIHYGCKDPKALNYEYFSASNPSLCKYQTITPTFTRNLKYKMIGDDVKKLQVYLNTHGYVISTSGPGSRNNETTLFGPLTKKAVIKFQLANKLIGDGIVGPITRSIMFNIN